MVSTLCVWCYTIYTLKRDPRVFFIIWVSLHKAAESRQFSLGDKNVRDSMCAPDLHPLAGVSLGDGVVENTLFRHLCCVGPRDETGQMLNV